MERRAIRVTGQVQGVGFRPFVHGLALRHGLAGWVRNDGDAVRVEVEGPAGPLREFEEALSRDLPGLAWIEELVSRQALPEGARGFRILPGKETASRSRPLIPPDTATCADCLAELADPADRRYRHPFVNCTHCGPRYTIVRTLPYDRPGTTMGAFALCPSCRCEYEDASDRRFHAQPTSCPDCGPTLSARDGQGATVASGEAALARAAETLRFGGVIAVKGLGGYHVACDACDSAAVDRLRAGKGREAKPFAVMVRDMTEAARVVRLDDAARMLLGSPRAPIVLCHKRSGTLASAVAPGNRYLGVLLPYTALHRLLMDEVATPLVMTSANPSGEPIIHRDDDAVQRLGPLVDLVLGHDRPIHVPCDDSVLQVAAGGPLPVRRSRGFVPEAVPLGFTAPRPVLAAGGHQKNTFCLLVEDRAYPSAHVGELDGPAARRAWRASVDHLCSLVGVTPEVVAHDLHPDYASTRLVLGLAREGELPTVGVQHHHAHVAACMAENGVEAPVLGVAFDGSGYGADGTVWGGEFLLADRSGFRRIGHLAAVPLPGGEAAVREPWRMAVAHLRAAVGGDVAGHPALARIEEAVGLRRIQQVEAMIAAGLSCPATSSVGRLFDAVAALLGLGATCSFEAQAALALEAVADVREAASFPVDLTDGDPAWTWDSAQFLHHATAQLARGDSPAAVAGRFLNAVRDAVAEGCVRARDEFGLETVALTGGVFLNRILTEKTVSRLEKDGFRVLLHRRVPSGDGGLSLGQAAVAAAAATPTSTG